jgi:S-adenosylmethionine hydrolase
VFITFLSDYGLQDDFVGTCHGVIKRVAPDVQIIDITHGISPQAVMQGALVLRNTLPYMPPGVSLAVVDPGVGGPRRPLALSDRAGGLYVGPDNGLLLPAAEAMGGIEAAHVLTNPAYAIEPVSRTFHGRDLFAPAAAHLALGVALEALGPPLDPESLVRLDLPEPELGADRIVAVVLDVDRYGNMQLNLTRRELEAAGIEPGTRIELEFQGERYYATAARTFADARPGDIILYEDSYRNIAVAINRGNAAEMLAARAGQPLRIHVLDQSLHRLAAGRETV